MAQTFPPGVRNGNASAIKAKSENSIHRFRGTILRFTTKDFERFFYSTILISDSTIFPSRLSRNQSPILLFYRFYDFPILRL